MGESVINARFEYTMLFDASLTELENAGRSGWELVSVTPSPCLHQHREFYFKRRLPNAPAPFSTFLADEPAEEPTADEDTPTSFCKSTEESL